MELKDIILDYKKRFHLSNNEIAQRFQVSSNTVARWLRGEIKTLQEDSARNISNVLGYDIQSLLNGNAITLKRPILGNVKAGYNLFLESSYLGEEKVSLEEYRKGDYFLKVQGNSMINDGIVDGSLVYIKQCNYVEKNEIAVVLIDEEVTIKRLVTNKDGYTLKASNPEVKERFFTFKEAKEHSLQIIGKVLYSKTYAK